jgi:two-component system, LytTR family, sensor kinase
MTVQQNFSSRNFIIGYVLWWLCWIVIQAIVLYYSIGLDWKLAIKDATLNNILLALAGLAMFNILRFYQPGQSFRLISSIGLAILSIKAMQWTAGFIVTTDPDYIIFLERSLLVRGLFAWIMISLLAAMSWLWFYIQEQRENENRKLTTEKLAREAELASLRQQLQPHFLFNSLNSISALAGTRPEEARKMIQQLSDFLRGTLKKDDSQLVTFSEELQHLQLYLEIEKVRFGHRLKTEIRHEEQTTISKLPTLLLQPIVENAIKFGLYDTVGEIIITIAAKMEQGYLVVTVSNPYDPATAQPKQGTGFGLNSVQRRLYLLFARNDLVTTTQEENIFTTTVRIPQTQ